LIRWERKKIGVKERINDAVYKVKRYEDARLEYTGINRRAGERVGLFDTVISREEFVQVFENVTAPE
jgi:hypothetical protein